MSNCAEPRYLILSRPQRLHKNIQRSLLSPYEVPRVLFCRPQQVKVLSPFTMGSTEPISSPSPNSPKPRTKPVLAKMLRYTLSEKEYETLHHYLLRRFTPTIRNKIPSTQQYKSFNRGRDDYNASAVRASLRVFVATQSGLRLWTWISEHFLRRGKAPRYENRRSEQKVY